MDIRLEKLKLKQAGWAAGLIETEFKKEPYNMVWAQDLTEIVKKQITRSPELAFKIIADEKDAGILLCAESLWEPAGKACFIEMVVVEEKFQKKGIGRTVLHLLEEKLKKEGYALMTLMSDAGSAAFGFYEREEFKKSRWVFVEKELK